MHLLHVPKDYYYYVLVQGLVCVWGGGGIVSQIDNNITCKLLVEECYKYRKTRIN